MLSFETQTFWILPKFNLAVFPCAFVITPKKTLPNPWPWKYIIFYSKNALVFPSVFKSLIHSHFWGRSLNL
jgi:hypothetical protein